MTKQFSGISTEAICELVEEVVKLLFPFQAPYIIGALHHGEEGSIFSEGDADADIETRILPDSENDRTYPDCKLEITINGEPVFEARWIDEKVTITFLKEEGFKTFIEHLEEMLPSKT